MKTTCRFISLSTRLATAVLAVVLAGCAAPSGSAPGGDRRVATRPADNAGAARSPVERLHIEQGLADFQVFQRDAQNHATIRCSGTTTHAGFVMGGVFSMKDLTRAAVPLAQVGSAAGGKWSAEIKGVPTGGPYKVLLSVRDGNGRSPTGIAKENVLVGDLWLLAGQSNMQGYGDMVDVEPPSPFVHNFESRYQWAVAQEPLHRLSESPNVIHFRIFSPKVTDQQIEVQRRAPRQPVPKGTGLGLSFAKELYARTGIPVGLVPCAHGGTSMTQWDPARRDERGKSLYGSMYDRVQAVGGRVKGVLWYQGESDANPNDQGQYYARFHRLIEAVRKDLGDSALPFYLVQISRVARPAFNEKAWKGVQEDERRIAQELKNVRTASAIDLDLDDIIHIGTQGQKRLGRRLALIADHDLFGNGKIDIGPQLRSVVLEKPGVIRVTYEHVNGALCPKQHIAGFALRAPGDKPGPEFYDVSVDPGKPGSLLCQFSGELLPGTMLWYGPGLNPYCNLVDEQDMAAQAFGPIPVASPTTASKPSSR